MLAAALLNNVLAEKMEARADRLAWLPTTLRDYLHDSP